jgi:stage II sporulation protein AA (anti-sigma F factor antagonist)
MDVTYEVRNGVLVISVDQELDHHSAGQIRMLTEDVLAQRKVKGILFDFSNTTFMDSSGVGMIMGRYKKMKTQGGFVGVTGVSPAINRILEISGLYKLVEVFQMEY